MLRLTALAQSRLSRLLARRLGADDIVLSAWRSFFVAANRSRLQVPDDDNILRRAPQNFVLTDFGFSRSIDDGHSARGGTLGFLAPEQLSSAFGTISERTDIYGFGALLYFLVTRRAPFEADDERDVIHRILSSDRPPEVAFPGMPLAKLATQARACLAKEPSERITTMEEVRSALHQ